MFFNRGQLLHFQLGLNLQYSARRLQTRRQTSLRVTLYVCGPVKTARIADAQVSKLLASYHSCLIAVRSPHPPHIYIICTTLICIVAF